MATIPPTKPPGEFTGHGLEIIGNPDDFFSECVTLAFQDGKFLSIGLPTRSLVSDPDHSQPPEKQPQARIKSVRRYQAKKLAETFQKNPADINAKKQLKVIRKTCREARLKEKTCREVRPKEDRPKEDRATNNDVRKILSGNISPNWSYQGLREKVAVSSLMELARELNRPPREWELIERMKSMTESINGGTVKILQGGDDNNLSGFLRNSGFQWLERRKRGYQGER